MDQQNSDTEYLRRVIEHYRTVDAVTAKLFEIAQALCPGFWVFQVVAYGAGTTNKVYRAAVTNGDDNITAEGSTIGGAVAGLIAIMLSGGVFPLTGNNGLYVAPQDRPNIDAES